MFPLYGDDELRILAGFIPVGSGYWQDSYLWAQDTDRIHTCGLRILTGFLPVGSGY